MNCCEFKTRSQSYFKRNCQWRFIVLLCSKMQLSWRRPSNVPFPCTWHTFKAKDVDSDGLVDYTVEDLPEERNDEAIQHMIEYYLHGEPLAKSKGLHLNRISLICAKIKYLKLKFLIRCCRRRSFSERIHWSLARNFKAENRACLFQKRFGRNCWTEFLYNLLRVWKVEQTWCEFVFKLNCLDNWL